MKQTAERAGAVLLGHIMPTCQSYHLRLERERPHQLMQRPQLFGRLQKLRLNACILVTQEQRIEAVRRVRGLLERFCEHPLRREIDSADERHHEVPYSRMNGEYSETGYIDLLYRKGDTWHVIDFKTDSISSATKRKELIGTYTKQLNRYAGAIQELIGLKTELSLCLLDDEDRILVTRIG